MIKGKKLIDFCNLTLKMGVNLQKGQGLEIICPIEKHEVAETMTKCAYKMGARIVNIRWENQKIDKINYKNATVEELSKVPKWVVNNREYLVKNNFCYVAIDADDPAMFKSIPAKKLGAVSMAKGKALKKFSDSVMNNEIRWCVVSVPTKAWAKQVFKNSKNAQEELSLAIEKCMRLDKENPVKEWEKHIETLEKRANFLNEKHFEYLVYKNSIGTDFKIGLADDHKWLSAKEKAQDGVEFIANMPTEEVFTAPHREKGDGIVKSALPLSYNGNLIKDFSITFKNGKVVDFNAKEGYETLKSIIETDEGTRHLGEVALIGKNSPIAQSGILFYNTLFDENASCHLALGKAYPSTIYNGDKLTQKELLEKGVNDSIEHVDFMIGTKDLSIIGIEKNGKETTLFKDGEWAI